VKPLRHEFTATGKTERCGRCGVERSRSKGLPEYRLPSGAEGDRVLKKGTWSYQDPGCRDPRQSDLFASDLSLPEGFAPVEKTPPAEAIVATIELTPNEKLAKIFAKSHVNMEEDDQPVAIDEMLSIFTGSKIVREGDPEFMHAESQHHASIEHGHPHPHAIISLALDPEGRHLGIYERWHVFALSPRPLAKGLEQIVEGTLGDALQKTEWMKKALVFRPEAILVVDGPRKRIELRQHSASKKTKAFWSIAETVKMEVDAT